MSDPSVPYKTLGFAQTTAAILSFVSSLRIFGVIVASKDLRLLTSYQLIAYTALIECCQMTSTSVVGIMVAEQDTFNEQLHRAVVDVAIVSWITLIVLRFILAFNRFTVITSFSRLQFLKSDCVNWLTLLFPTCVLIAMITTASIYGLPYAVRVELAGWDYNAEHFFAVVEKLSTNAFSWVSFLLYVIVSLYILKTKNQALTETKLNDVKLLISTGLTFIYELVIGILFNWVLPHLPVSIVLNGILGVLWTALPAFNGLMLLTINKSFRQRFFASCILRKNVITVTITASAQKTQ